MSRAPALAHRDAAYGCLSGVGLEIGALHEPAVVPAGCQVVYFDAITEAEAARLFPEIPPEAFVHVACVGDLDHDGLGSFAGASFDFVIINHVIEHLANPLRAVREVFRLLRPGGHAVISVPDKRFTYDRNRAVIAWEHLWTDYEAGVTENTDEHYLDFLHSAGAHVFDEPPENLAHHVSRARTRREHAHAWTSAVFREHLERAFAAFGIAAAPVHESTGDENGGEYFSIWRKAGATLRPPT